MQDFSSFNVTRGDGRTYQYDIRESKKFAEPIRSKEIILGYKVLCKFSGRVLIDVRVYTARRPKAFKHYAIVWLYGKVNGCGIGKASGHVHGRESRSIYFALRDLGVAHDVCEIAKGGDISRALDIMCKDIFNEEGIIVDFFA